MSYLILWLRKNDHLFLPHYLDIKEPSRQLYLALPTYAYNYFESMRLIQLGIEKYKVKMIIFDPENEAIETWIN